MKAWHFPSTTIGLVTLAILLFATPIITQADRGFHGGNRGMSGMHGDRWQGRDWDGNRDFRWGGDHPYRYSGDYYISGDNYYMDSYPYTPNYGYDTGYDDFGGYLPYDGGGFGIDY